MKSPCQKLEEYEDSMSRLDSYFEKAIIRKYELLYKFKIYKVEYSIEEDYFNIILVLEDNYNADRDWIDTIRHIELGSSKNDHHVLFNLFNRNVNLYNCPRIKATLNDAMNFEYYESSYTDICKHFSDEKNISAFFEYANRLYKLLYYTTYLECLPLAYTFLLCNKKNKNFPKDIANLIAHKILWDVLY